MSIIQYEPWIDGKLAPNGRRVMENFSDWFEKSEVVDQNHQPLCLFHGTSGDFDSFRGFSHWGSVEPTLANSYADFRACDGSSVSIVPVFMKANAVFDADFLPSGVKIAEFFSEMRRQALERGHPVDDALCAEGIRQLKRYSAQEESGPSYSRHDFWHQPSMYFGSDGADIVRSMFKSMGFDAIKMTEDDHLTYGVLDASQVKSALGNSGLYLKDSRSLVDDKNTHLMYSAQRAKLLIENINLNNRPSWSF